MRFFIALEIPEHSKQELKQVQDLLHKALPGFKPTDNDKLHLTIAFVGERDASLKEPLTKVITKAARGIQAFRVEPAYIDGFPSLHNAKVLWAGIKGDIDKLFIVRERIKDGLKELKLETDERRFVPHIALGKLSNFNLEPYQELELEKIEQMDFQPILVDSIKVFESIPNHGFHRHNTLAEIKLA